MNYKPKHPVQPVVKDDHGTYRFKENKLVRAFLEAARQGKHLDLNTVASMDFSQEDRVQFAQLIGYSVSGWGDLSYVAESDWEAAQVEVRKTETVEDSQP